MRGKSQSKLPIVAIAPQCVMYMRLRETVSGKNKKEDRKTDSGKRNQKKIYIVGVGGASEDTDAKKQKKEVIPYRVGDIVKMKKPHPCGSKEWEILRTGADFKLRCKGCQHEVMLPRRTFEKAVRSVSGQRL